MASERSKKPTKTTCDPAQTAGASDSICPAAPSCDISGDIALDFFPSSPAPSAAAEDSDGHAPPETTTSAIDAILARMEQLEAAFTVILNGGKKIVDCGKEAAFCDNMVAVLDKIVAYNTWPADDHRLEDFEARTGEGFSSLSAELQEYVTSAAGAGAIGRALQAINIGIGHIRKGICAYPAAMASELNHLHRISTLVRSARMYWAIHYRKNGMGPLADRILAKDRSPGDSSE